MNLAIAVGEIRHNRRETNAGRRSPGYLLVTNTLVVAEFGRQLMSRRNTDNDVIQFLAAEQFLPADLPVATAADVARVEMLGLFRDPGISLLRATEIRRHFQDIADTLDLEVTSRKLSNAGASLESYAGALRLRRGVVVDALQSLLRPLLDPDDPLRRLEEHRATELSIEGMRHAQRGDEPSPWEALRLKSIGFLSLLSQVQASLVRAAGTEYQVDWSESPNGKNFRITLGNADQPQEILITGSVSLGGAGQQSEYVARWPVVCGIDDFWIAVRAFSGVDIADGPLSAMPAVARLESEVPLETDCLVARTHDAAFIVSLTDVLGAYRTGAKCLADLARIIQKLNPKESEMISIQIHKDRTALSFSIIPNEGDSGRSLSARSLSGLSKLAVLYARTGLFLADEDALGKALTFIETESQKYKETKVAESSELPGSKFFASTSEIPPVNAETSETIVRITHTAQSGRSKVEMELQAHLYPGSGDFGTLIGTFLAAISEKRGAFTPGVTGPNPAYGSGGSNILPPGLAQEPEVGSALQQRSTSAGPTAADIGILTVIGPEMLAVKHYLAQRPQFLERRGTTNSRLFYEGSLAAPVGAYHKVAVTRTLEQGNRSIMAAYQALVEEYRPTVVVLLGIAGAIHSDISLCDVALAEAIYYYDRRAVKREGASRRILSYNIAPWLRVWINRLYEMYRLHPIFDAEPGSPSDKFKMLFGPIGAGEAVIKYRDADEREWLQTVNDKTLALETEAAGFAQQFTEGELSLGHRTKGYLIVRGISDHADVQKDDTWQYLASCNAIRALEELLKTMPAPLSGLVP